MTNVTRQFRESTVTPEITAGAILIRDNAPLPRDLQFEAAPIVRGWSLVKDFDAYRLDRETRKAGWHFFCLAGEIKATVFGIDGQSMVRRAIERILANPKSQNFNALEITRVASMGSRKFPLVHYVTVSAQSRHIQENLFLRARHVATPEMVRNETARRSTGIAGGHVSLLRELTEASNEAPVLARVSYLEEMGK